MTALYTNENADQANTPEIVATPASSVRLAMRADSRAWTAAGPHDALTLREQLILQIAGPTPRLLWSDSSLVEHQVDALAPLPFTAGIHWLVVELIFDDGSGDHTVEFLWSDDATNDPDTVIWTSLGVDTIPGTTDVDSGGVLSIVAGLERTYYFVAQFQIDGVTVAQPQMFALAEGVGVFADAYTNLWTIDGPTAAIVEYPPPVDPVKLAGAVRGAIANAPRVMLPEDVISPLRARVLRLPDLTTVASLTGSFADQAREQRNATGSGSLTLLIDDPAAALIRRYDLIQLIIESQVAFTMLNEDPVTTVIAAAEESGEQLAVSGRGHLALLEWGMVYPSGGPGQQPVERDRVFNWTSPQYDDSSWDASTDVSDLPLRPTPSNGPPATYRGATGDTATFAPGGPVFYRGVVDVPADGTYVIFWATDNWGRLYGNGVELAAQPGTKKNWLEAEMLEVTLTAGPTTFAARVFNKGSATPGPLGNPVGLYFALTRVDLEGEVIEVIAVADGTWKALGRPSATPGMTPGEVARIVLEEWQARAVAAGHDIPVITLTCTDQVDSAGQPWVSTPNIATKVGNDLLTFFTEISATYWEMRLRPASLELDLFTKGTIMPSGVTYERAPATNPDAGNVRSRVRRPT